MTADGHEEAVPEAAGHPPCLDREGLQHQLFERVQVHPAAQGEEDAEESGNQV